MDPTRIAEEIDRRYFVGAAAMTFAGAQFGITNSANAQAIKPSAKALQEIKPEQAVQESCRSSKSTPACSISATPKRAPPTALRSFCCTAGLTTFTALSTSRLFWPRRVTG